MYNYLLFVQRKGKKCEEHPQQLGCVTSFHHTLKGILESWKKAQEWTKNIHKIELGCFISKTENKIKGDKIYTTGQKKVEILLPPCNPCLLNCLNSEI